MPQRKKLHLALLGFGKMGQGFYNVLQEKKKAIEEQTGFEIILSHILVRNARYKRPRSVDKSLFTTDINTILHNKEIKVAIDAMGGIEPTFTLIKKLIQARINIISVNRALLATKMHDLSDLANENEIHFLTEPALGGGIPIATILQRDLVANRISHMYGIVSGVSNYILDEMHDKKRTLKDVLGDSAIVPMTESLSIVDYEGSDAAMKVAIIAATAFGLDVNYLHIFSEGISNITNQDIHWATHFGYRIKQLAIIKEHNDRFELRVHPTLVPEDHPLASVKGQYNAYYFRTDLVGEYMVYGLGIGTSATSSLILRDIVDIGNRIYNNPRRLRFLFTWNGKPMQPMDEIVTSYYLRFPCVDRPGVMGEITTMIGKHNINITSAHAEVDQNEKGKMGFVHIFVEAAAEKQLTDALQEISAMNIIRDKIKFLRILDV